MGEAIYIMEVEMIKEYDWSLMLKILDKGSRGGCDEAKYYSEKIRDGRLDENDNESFIVQKICFSNCFAKAFFGTEEVLIRNIKTSIKEVRPIWEYHISRMVLHERPIMYLKQFVK